MQFNFLAITFVLLATICVRNSQQVRYDGTFDVLISAFMRIGTECILNQECGKKTAYTNHTQAMDALLSLERTANWCFLHFFWGIKRAAQSNNNEKQVPNPGTNRKLENSIELYCPAVLELAECLELVDTVTKKCGGFEASSFIGLAKFLCKNNARKMKDLIRADFMTCLQETTNPGPSNGQYLPFQACLNHYFNDNYSAKDLENHIVKDTCKAASNLKVCGYIALEQCVKKYPQAKKITETMFSELNKEIPETTKCFSQSSPGPAKQRQTPKPQTNENRIHWRAKYKG